MPVYEIDTDQGVFEIDADREPTQAEALAAIGGAPAAPKPSPTAQQEAFKQQFIEARTQDPLTQAASALAAPVRAGAGLAAGLADILYKGVQGVGSIYGKAAGQQTLGDLLKSYYGDVAQTAQEIVPRAAYDLGQGAVAGFQSPETAAQTVRSLNTLQNPLAMAIQALVNPQAAVTPERAQQLFEEDLVNQAFAKQGEQGVLEFAQQQAGLPSLGTANIDVARAAPLLIGAEALPGAIRSGLSKLSSIPAIETTGTIASSVGGALKGGVKMAVEKITPKSLVENIVNTLDPRANAINPSKQVQAMKTADRSVRRVVSELTPEDLAHPQTLADNATLKLQDIHSQREAMSGTTFEISLDPLADAYMKVANDPVIKTKFPKIIPQLEETAAQYRGKSLSGSDAERFNQVLNADNHTLYEKVPGARAAAEKANPELAAGLEASKALRNQLDNAFGPEFGELGKDYGAWKEIAELSQRQAVKQAKIENRLSLYEGLSALQAIGTSGSPFKAAAALMGGQVLKYAGSPLSRFAGSSRRLASAIEKGEIPPRLPAAAQKAIPPPLPSAPVSTPQAPQFSPTTLRALREFGVPTDSPYWQSIGEQLETAAGPARSRALLSETINR